MRNFFHNIFIGASPLLRWTYRTFYPIVIALLGVVMLQACYSTAVKGVPVKELVMAQDQRVVKTTSTEEEGIDSIALMSGSRGNKTFTEISGVPEYLIGPLDVLEISSHVGAKVTATTVTVNNRGKISYYFIDDLDVNGLAPSQLDELITKEMSAFIKNPRIDVIVKEFNSKSVTVLGEVASLRQTITGDAGSGRIFLEGKTTMMDLIAMAGGYTVNADIKNVTLIRQGKKYKINIYDILEKGDESRNVILDDGDVIDVPELPVFGEKIYVMGEVHSQGIYSLNDARDLLGAISIAGSITSVAKEENTLIVRGYGTNENGPLVMMSDVKALLRNADLGQNIELQDGDLVYVPRMLIGDINDWIENTTPMLDFLLYPQRLTGEYFIGDYLHLNRE